VRPVVAALPRVPRPPARGPSAPRRRLPPPSEPGADTALPAELAADALAVTVRPGPLSEGAADEVVRDRLGSEADAAFSKAVITATRGNPLLLHELLKALAAEGVEPLGANAGVVGEIGPRAASRSVLIRLARLSPTAIAVARAAAVLGDGADLTAIAALADVDEAAAAAASGELVRAEILGQEAPLGFVHPLVRAAATPTSPLASSSCSAPARRGCSQRRLSPRRRSPRFPTTASTSGGRARATG
jgi:hypothetical protein